MLLAPGHYCETRSLQDVRVLPLTFGLDCRDDGAFLRQWASQHSVVFSKAMAKLSAEIAEREPAGAGVSSVASAANLWLPDDEPRIIFALHTANHEKYQKKLQSQLDTWAAGLPEGRVIAIGPRCVRRDCGGNGKRLWQPSHCKDMWLGCKVMTYLRQARAHSTEWEFDWVFGMNEDQYVVRPILMKALAQFDPSQPLVVAHMGCGLHWKHHPLAKKGQPRPQGYGPDTKTCEGVHQHGGVCGGTGIAWSRGAIDRLFETDVNTTWLANNLMQADPTIACLAYSHNLTLKHKTWGGLIVTESPAKLKPAVGVYHVVGTGQFVQQAMHELHDQFNPKSADNLKLSPQQMVEVGIVPPA